MSLGLRLKRLRDNKRMSVKDLASAIGVSRSFIYQLERGEVSPSYSTLRSMAGAMGTTVSVLVGDGEPEEWLVSRKEGRKHVIWPGAGEATSWRLELLPFLGSRNRRMQPLLIQLEPGAAARDFPFDHEKDDLLFVTEGEVTLVLEGGREMLLRAGDSAYLLFETALAVENRGDKPATCLWVLSPPAG
jgi:transcriptional regulator with XRE-family HTH domain